MGQKVSFTFSCLVLLKEMGGRVVQDFNLSLWCGSDSYGAGWVQEFFVWSRWWGEEVRPAALGHWPFLLWGSAS